MVQKVILEEEAQEKEAYDAFSKKVSEEYDLKNYCAIAVRENNSEIANSASKQLELVTSQRIEIEENWLRLKIKSVKARRDFESKNDSDFEMLENLSPNFTKAVWEAEDELNRHLRKYGRE